MASHVKGGNNLERFLRNTKRMAERQSVIEVGFRDARIAPLAKQLEFGNPSTNLPERPAFRLGVTDLERELPDYVAKLLKDKDLRQGVGLTAEDAKEIAIFARDILRKSYHDFHGTPLSQRQIERKAGTEYADEQLIGSEGPQLIEHIKAYVDGAEVG